MAWSAFSLDLQKQGRPAICKDSFSVSRQVAAGRWLIRSTLSRPSPTCPHGLLYAAVEMRDSSGTWAKLNGEPRLLGPF